MCVCVCVCVWGGTGISNFTTSWFDIATHLVAVNMEGQWHTYGLQSLHLPAASEEVETQSCESQDEDQRGDGNPGCGDGGNYDCS